MDPRFAFRSAFAVLSAAFLFAAAPAYSQGTVTVRALAVDPQTTTTVYAGTSDGVFKSLDGGANWSASGLAGIAIQILSITPSTPTTPSIVYAGTGTGLLKSTDGGATWIATGLEVAVDALVIDPETPTSLYAVTPTGLFKSTNSGESWTATALMNFDFLWYGYFPATATVQTVAIAPPVAPAPTAVLYAGLSYISSDSYDTYPWGEVFKSTDGGSSWIVVGPAGDPWSVPWGAAPILATAPQTPTISTTLYTSGSHDYHVCWIRDDGAPLDCSRLSQTSVWVSSLVVNTETPTTLYAGTNLGVFKSVSAGTAWISVNTGLTDILQANGVGTDVGPLSIDPLTPTTLYAGTQIGVFKSTNGGISWSPTGLFQQSSLSAVALNPTPPRHVQRTVLTVGQAAEPHRLQKCVWDGDEPRDLEITPEGEPQWLCALCMLSSLR